jgi:hypothetical protein
MTKYSQAASSVNYSQQDNHDSDHQQNVNETAHGIRSNYPQQPQDEHNDGNGIKHDIDLSIYGATKNPDFIPTTVLRKKFLANISIICGAAKFFPRLAFGRTLNF